MALSPEQQDWVTQTGRQSFHWGTIPDAYKDIDVVMQDARDLVEIEHELRQLLNVKGT